MNFYFQEQRPKHMLFRVTNTYTKSLQRKILIEFERTFFSVCGFFFLKI